MSNHYGLFNAKIGFIWKCYYNKGEQENEIEEERERRQGEKEEEREKTRVERKRFDYIYLLNGISTPYGLFNTKISFIWKCLILIIIIFSMFHCIFKKLLFCLQLFGTQLSNINYSFLIQIICTQLNGFKYSYPTLIILFNNNNLPPHSCMFSCIPIKYR